MKTDINFLEKAVDYRNQDGENIFAYGVKWEANTFWLHEGYGISHTEYISVEQPIIPQKILILADNQSMPQIEKKSEEVRFYGQLIYTHEKNLGRREIIFLAPFKEELEECSTEVAVIEKIQEIISREKNDKGRTT